MKTLTLAKLASLTGVPPASIHHYLKQGLLPPPKRLSPNRFLYDERHVQGLRLIRTLRERRRLPLPLVRRIMPELLYLDGGEAFRPEMWDRALAPARRQQPSGRILAAAKDAFARRGYGDVNVDEICEAARLAKGSFYRYYRSKEELFFAAARSVARDVLAPFAERPALVRSLSMEQAGNLLARAIRPAAPLFLELLARSLQGRSGEAAVAAEIFRTAAEEVGRSVRGAGSVEERGSRAIGAAMAVVLRAALAPFGAEPPAMSGIGQPPAAGS